MKILWVVNHQMANLANALGYKAPISGTWLIELSNALTRYDDVDLSIICPAKDKETRIQVNSINFFLVRISKYSKFITPTRKYAKTINDLLYEISPDIIHLHGCEFAYGLTFLQQTKVPVVISIQGMISEISKNRYNWGGINRRSLLTSFDLHSLAFLISESLKSLRNKYRATAEIKQITSAKNLIGRTDWDRAHSYFYNKNVSYYYLQETLRKEFLNVSWDIEKINKFVIFSNGGFSSPLKGIHQILEAIALLKNDFPNLKLRVAGNNIFKNKNSSGYIKYLQKLIKKLDLLDNICFTGPLNSQQMANELKKAHVFVLGSSIENSSNSLGEALCVGIPCVVPFVGGIPSLVQDGSEALFYRFGDNEHMAWGIKKIFTSNIFAIKLSEKAKRRSKELYNNEYIISNLLNIYSKITD